MANEHLLAPVSEEEPCGQDLQWDPDFMVVSQMLDNLEQAGEEGIVAGQMVGSEPDLDDIRARVTALCKRTKDLRLMAMLAELGWRDEGLPGFAQAMETLVALLELHPGADDGIHPRADPEDGDLGVRQAVLAKLLHLTSRFAATYGWGMEPNLQVRQDTAASLRGVFDAWHDRLGPAFADDVPSRDEAWQSIKALLGDPEPASSETGAESDAAIPVPPSTDAWDLLERAADVMATQDRHSPALPILRLMLGWRGMDILDIAKSQRVSGVTLEQLLDSIDKQLQPPQQLQPPLQ